MRAAAKVWTKEEDDELTTLVRGAGDDDEWNTIAERFGTGQERSAIACEKRWDLYLSKAAGAAFGVECDEETS